MEQTILLVIQVISAFALIGLILIQQGKGADAGASFGGGASQTVFGSSGSGNFLTKSTNILAMIFFATSLLLAYFTKQSISSGTETSLFEGVVVEAELPVVPEPALDGVVSGSSELPDVDIEAIKAAVDNAIEQDDLTEKVVTADDIDSAVDKTEAQIEKGIEEALNP